MTSSTAYIPITEIGMPNDTMRFLTSGTAYVFNGAIFEGVNRVAVSCHEPFNPGSIFAFRYVSVTKHSSNFISNWFKRFDCGLTFRSEFITHLILIERHSHVQ